MIRVGIGGWVFAPWRGAFYPKGLPQARELAHASRSVTSIEINGTFYRTQKPESFRKWADETPDDFVFSLKAPRYATHRRVLAEAGDSVERFFGSGVLELKHKLGPILWQFDPRKTFEPDDFAAFLALLPQRLEGQAIRHVVEVRHASFLLPAFVALLRKFSVAAVLADSAKHPLIAETWRGISRSKARTETLRQARPIAAADLRAMLDDLAGGAKRLPADAEDFIGSSQDSHPDFQAPSVSD